MASHPSRGTPLDFGFGRLFDAVAEAVIVADATSDLIVLWNAGAERIFGYEPAEALGMSLEQIVPERLREWHRAGLARYSRTGHGAYIDSHEPIELPALHKDGSERTIELSLNPLDDAPMPGRFAFAVIRDVTDRARLTSDLRENQTRLEAALHLEREASEHLRKLGELRNEFLAMAAHDLRSPTTVIAGFASMLEESWDDLPSEQRADMLKRITANTRRLADLISDVMHVTQIESPQFSVRIESVDMGALAEGIVREQSEHARLTLDVEPDLPPASVDPARQVQVLRNLISNALKYSPADSPVTVSIQRSARALRVSVSDRGPGIAPEDVQNLFQKFSRLKQPGSVEGTGLGLYICKALVEAQGGTIWVESHPGAGATFRYTVPAAPAAPAAT